MIAMREGVGAGEARPHTLAREVRMGEAPIRTS